MGSGLIYAAIIVMWALYFIPRWLRRHEELSESRSVERFDRAMRILSRREATPDQRAVVMPARPATSTASVVSKRSRPSASATRRERSIAIRRRRVLAALLMLTVSLALVTPITPAQWWMPVLLLLAVLADLVHLRVQARRRTELSLTRAAVRRRTRSRLRRFDSAERIVQARKVLAEQREAAEANRVQAEWAAHEAARREDERVAAEAMGWEPTPFPLPTYVTKPMATRVGRPIDLTVPGRWSDAHGVGASSEWSYDVAADGPAQDPAGNAAEHRAERSEERSAEPFDQTGPPETGWVPEHTTSATAASYDDYAEELEAILERRAVND